MTEPRTTTRPIETTRRTVSVLVVGSERLGRTVSEVLDDDAFDVSVGTDPAGLVDAPRTGRVDCVVCHVAGPADEAGLAALRELRRATPEVPCLAAGPDGDPATVEAAVDAGATDFVEVRPGTDRCPRLPLRVDQCAQTAATRDSLRSLEQAVSHVRRLTADAAASLDAPRGGTENRTPPDVQPTVGDRGAEGVPSRHAREFRFLEEAVEGMGIGIAVYPSDGRVVYANPYFADLLGTTVADLEGRHVAELNPDFDRDRFADYWNSFDPGDTRRREATHRSLADGSTVPVETVTTHVRVEGVDYHVGTIQDISDRKRRERQLRKFKQAVEHAGHAVVVTEPDGTIEYVNPAFESVSGYARDEAVGKRPSIVKSGEHDDAFYADLWGTVLGGDVWQGELVNERKDGTTYTIEQTIAPIHDDDGNVERFVAVNNDITELKTYEAELERQNERLEAFARTVAHDLRNPLNVIEGHLDLACTVDDDGHLEAIERSVDRMQTLIEELLSLAEMGQAVLEPTPSSVEEMAATAWRHVDTTGATLELREDCVVSVDECRTLELFENLFRNSVEHGSTGSQTQSDDSVEHGDDVTVYVGRHDGGFYVADDGPGIPPDRRGDVLESGYTTSEDGTGFGLAIVKQIVDAHGWTVVVTESDEGGARFEFSDVDVLTGDCRTDD
jgi:PAS domain S-box-containing protein